MWQCRNKVAAAIIAVALLFLVVGVSPTSAQTFGPRSTLNNNAPSDTGIDFNPQLTTDGAGNWVAVWFSNDWLGDTIDTDFDILVSRSTNDGASWSDPVALDPGAGADTGNDTSPQVATDGAGNWVAVWLSTDSLGGTIDTDADILVSRSTNDGASWSNPAMLNTNAGSDTGDDILPQVTTDGAGNWVAVWQSNDWLGDTIGTDYDILVSRSTDAGFTWSDPATLNTNAVGDTGLDQYPQVTTDGAGNWVAVWDSNDLLGGTIGTDFDILVSRSTDAGFTWSDPATLNTNAGSDTGDDSFPQVTTDGAGNWVAVWDSNDWLDDTIGTDSDILVSLSTDDGASWSDPATLNSNADSDVGSDDEPQVTTDGAGNWVAVWQSNDSLGGTIGTDNDILVSFSTDDGFSWSALEALNTNAASGFGTDSHPQVTTDGAGNWVAIWDSLDSLGGTIGADADIFFATGTGPDTDGDGLSDGAEVNVHGTDPLVVDTDGDGLSDGAEVNVHDTDPLVADTDGDGFSDGAEVSAGSDPKNSASTLLTILSFAPAGVLNTNAASDTGHDELPQVRTDGAGNWVAIWDSTDSLDGTIDTDADILVSRSSDDGASWSDPEALDPDAGSDTGDDIFPQVTTDGAGNWVAVWFSNDWLGDTIGTDNDILVSRSADAGLTWSDPTNLNTNAGSDSGTDFVPQVTTDGAGNWVAVWYSDDWLGNTVGTDNDILVSRSADLGVTWSDPASLNTNAVSDSGSDELPQLTNDGAGTWVAVWQSDDWLGDTIGTDLDILVSRSTDAGFTWSDPAALNTNAVSDTGDDFSSRVMTDGAGNWVAVWQSTEPLGDTIDTDNDILVSRSADAGLTWSDPTPLNTNAVGDSGSDEFPHLTTDGVGNWAAVWHSNELPGGTIGTDYDILVSRSSDDGASWSFPATLDTNADSDTGDDFAAQVTTDGAGNWVAVWQSNESLGGPIGSDSDIFFATGTGPDTDGDGLSDGAEVNVHGTDPNNADTDGDTVQDGSDCAPLDSQAWNLPGEVRDLLLTHTGGPGGTTTLSWTVPASLGGVAVVYDTVSSPLASNFTAGTCEETDDGSDVMATNTTVLAPGQVRHFVVRAGNTCGEGSSGTDSALNERNVVDCPSVSLTVFVTTAVFNGNLGGEAGANTICQNEADAALLPGTFKAMLSKANVTPTSTGLPYFLPGGTQVAANFADWFDADGGVILAPVNEQADGSTGSGSESVWTGTNQFGVSLADCLDWNSALSGEFGVVGNRTRSDPGWTLWASGSCDSSLHLYCFQID